MTVVDEFDAIPDDALMDMAIDGIIDEPQPPTAAIDPIDLPQPTTPIDAIDQQPPAMKKKKTTTTTVTTTLLEMDGTVSHEALLQFYYARLFPFRLFSSWLSYGART